MPRIWDSVVPVEDRQVFDQAGYGRTAGLGAHPALLVVDVTYAFTGEAPEPILESIKKFPTSCGERAWLALPAMRLVITCARANALPIIYTRMVNRAGGLAAGLWARKNSTAEGSSNESLRGLDFPDSIAPKRGDVVLNKESPSAFFGTPLLSYLHLVHADSLVVVGGTTSGCVRATAVDAFSYNFPVVVVEEATFDRAEVSHIVSLFDLHHKYADVVTLDEAQSMLEALPIVAPPVTGATAR